MAYPRTPDELAVYGNALYARVHEATVVPPGRIDGIENWEPALNRCHENVSDLCANLDEFTPVRGWLYFDMAEIAGFVRFVAHSVVRDANGVMWDITPVATPRRYPFIEAAEPPMDFAELVESGVTQFDVPVVRQRNE